MIRTARWASVALLAACAGTPRFEPPRSLSTLPWPSSIAGDAEVHVLAGSLSRVRTGPTGIVRFPASADRRPGVIAVAGHELVADPDGWHLDGTRVAGRFDSFVLVSRDGEPPRVVEAAPPPPPAPVPAFRAREVRHGSLALVEGIPVVRVEGTPVQAGRALGTLLAPQIRYLVAHYVDPTFSEGRDDALAAARRLARRIPARHREELRACAAAAGVSGDDLLLGNAMVELHRLPLCSAVALRGARTDAGTLLLGRNLDFPARGVLQHLTVVVRHGDRFASVTWPGFLGVLSGMNRDGLVAANLVAEYAERSLDGIPYPFLLRRVLEEARTVEEALALVRGSDRTVGNSLVFADAAGRAAVAEVTHRRMLVRRPAGDRLFATNLFRSEPTWPYDCPRYAELERRTRPGTGPWTVGRLPVLLDAVDIGWLNVQSMVFRPADRSLRLATGALPAAKRPFVRVPLFD